MRLQDMIPAKAGPNDPLHTANIMTYEHGSMVRALVRRRVKLAQGDKQGAKAYEAEAKIEHADLVMQCKVIADQMDWKMAEQEKIGLERFQERMEEIKSGTL